MMLMFVPTGKPIHASVHQAKDSSTWRVGYSIKIETYFQKLIKKGGDKSLNSAEGSIVLIGRDEVDDEEVSEFEFAGVMEYHKSREPDAEIPGSNETILLRVLVDDATLARAIQLSALGHAPTVTVTFPDSDLGFGDHEKDQKETGLSYSDDYVSPNLVWDVEKYPSLMIKRIDLGFAIGSAEESKPELKPEEVEVTAASQPATRAQIALLTSTVRNLGIGLGILLVILHFLH